MGSRHPNPKRVKIHRSYSVEETARLFGIHKNTVRSWLKHGLATIDRQRPTLIHGPELVRFLRARRNQARQPCLPGEIFCVKCRVPRQPAGNTADYLPQKPTSGNLRGLCPVCGILIHRRVNRTKLDDVRGNLEITFPQAPSRIGESPSLSVNCDSSTGD